LLEVRTQIERLLAADPELVTGPQTLPPVRAGAVSPSAIAEAPRTVN
jgi:hypothetical protein